MMYFIPWVVLLAFVILSVPIASWLEGRKMRAQFGAPSDEEDVLGDYDEPEGEGAEDEAAPEEGGDANEFGGQAEFEGEADFGGEDFSEFEEVK